VKGFSSVFKDSKMQQQLQDVAPATRKNTPLGGEGEKTQEVTISARYTHCQQYPLPKAYDELFAENAQVRPLAQRLCQTFEALSLEELQARHHAIDALVKTMGITFTVYSDGDNIDRSWPFDMIPRVLAASEWQTVALGLKQRLRALNLFINDLYHEQQVLKDKIIPEYLIQNSKNFRAACQGIRPPFEVWAHICGSDLVRADGGQFYVLEDNLRVPSGVSYMLENRKIQKRLFPELFEDYRVLPIDDYPNRLYETLAALSPESKPVVAVLTPGIFNSAYFEHSYLAQQMGAFLVEGRDLVVEDDTVFMRTINGLKRVDVIYRRIDDDFLDPEVFRKDSTLGVPGLMRAWRAGKVAIANAPGAGVADDKVIYSYVPKLIEYYLGESAILPNVPTYLCADPEECSHVLAHLEELVVKPANESGGYGMLIGPFSTAEQRQDFAQRITQDPRNYIAQPTLALSTVPTFVDGRIEPRHVDLRPFTLQADKLFTTTGGLTRVALVKGSLVVNSSQGGGSKDTWIVEG
jgi:uncharacterized circularly permuted ATP-grasp superfamily protein